MDAVECAVEFQKKIKTSNASSSTKVAMEFRIGINTGDVIKEKGNLLGEGVNIAARLEAFALAGGISISKSVFDYVKGKTKHEFNDLGIQKVKQNEFHAFDIVLDPSQKRSLKPKQSIGLIKPKTFYSLTFIYFHMLTVIHHVSSKNYSNLSVNFLSGHLLILKFINEVSSQLIFTDN